MTPREKLIEELKDRTVKLGLIFTHHQPSFDMSERFTVSSSDQPVLCTSHDLCYIEHYLFGYRDGMKADVLTGRADKRVGDQIGAALDWMGGDDD